MLRRAILLGCALSVPVARGDIFITRKVEEIYVNYTNVTLSPGCTASDMYGSSSCDLHWGNNYTMSVSASQDILAGSTVAVDAKLGASAQPLKFTCPACGGNCTVDIPISGNVGGITIPIMTKHLNTKMPDCPIPAYSKAPFIKIIKLSKSSPIPAKST